MSSSRAIRLLGGLTLCAFFASAFTPLSNALNRRFGVQPALRNGDVIVVLGSGIHAHGLLSERSMSHALHGIDLWRRGLAPLLLFSGPPSTGGPSEAKARELLARQLGLPTERVLLDSGGRTTRGEAQSIRNALEHRRAHRILLITDTRHLRRAGSAFRRAGFEVVPAPAPDYLASASSPQARLQLSRRIVEEMLAGFYYWLTDSRDRG